MCGVTSLASGEQVLGVPGAAHDADNPDAFFERIVENDVVAGGMASQGRRQVVTDLPHLWKCGEFATLLLQLHHESSCRPRAVLRYEIVDFP